MVALTFEAYGDHAQKRRDYGNGVGAVQFRKYKVWVAPAEKPTHNAGQSSEQ